ncbi:hypothetical protein [Microcystis sp. M42BS1]|uniref:hypothetical protein n=1 Tax=Microcystis sp. M42BS1 TaxID=2771192 RepID=UPI002582F252|nr:hypothetical protein [Microcystis sp. M42BS1]MCA2570706.1 hypothetical protein [Microcystis sp. M42BS1]
MKRPYWKRGAWNAVCDVCGFKFKSTQLRQRWDGLYTCSQDFETRHPQEFLRLTPERINVPWVRRDIMTNFVDEFVPLYVETGYVDSNYFGSG